MISLVNFILTSVNVGFTRVSMEITTRGLAVVILISGQGRDSNSLNIGSTSTPRTIVFGSLGPFPLPVEETAHAKKQNALRSPG